MRFDEIILTEKEFSGLKELNELTADGNSVFVEDSNRDILERFESLGLAEISVAQTFHPDAPRESSRRFSAPRQAKVTEKGFRYLLYCAGQEKGKADRLAGECSTCSHPPMMFRHDFGQVIRFIGRRLPRRDAFFPLERVIRIMSCRDLRMVLL